MSNILGENGHTALFGSTEGAVTGCTRLQQEGNPEAASVAAAAGNPGQMIVPAQSGGRRMTRKMRKGKKHNNHRRTVRSSRKMRRHHKAFHKGSKSKTRKGHEDFMTYKGSKMYDEKRLKKLIGRKTMRAPVFSFVGGKRKDGSFRGRLSKNGGANGIRRDELSVDSTQNKVGREILISGGKRKGFRKGSKSVTRKGHEDFMTYKGSKMYNEKKLKKLIGRKTVRAPIFPFIGGNVGAEAEMMLDDEAKRLEMGNRSDMEKQGELNAAGVSVDVDQAAKVGTESSVIDQLEAGSEQGQVSIQGITGGKAKGKGKGKGKKHHMKGGYCQYISNVPVGFGYKTGDVALSPNQSALANPAPISPYSSCAKH
jgi:acyl CoA:acetate/3-ketoacid CoA transferase alpha subunit